MHHHSSSLIAAHPSCYCSCCCLCCCTCCSMLLPMLCLRLLLRLLLQLLLLIAAAVLLAAAHNVDLTMARCSRSSLTAASRAAAHDCFAHAAAHAAHALYLNTSIRIQYQSIRKLDVSRRCGVPLLAHRSSQLTFGMKWGDLDK